MFTKHLSWRCIGLSLLLTACVSAHAETREARDTLHHEVRVGWGDQLFETLVWHATPQPKNLMPESYTATYNEHFRYSQHWFAEYQYRVNSWFGVGGMLDHSSVIWDEVTRNGLSQELSRSKNHKFYNCAVLATVRFTYLHTEYVSLYSGLGIGLNINGGTEQDIYGKKIAFANVIDPTWIGITVGHGHWFGSAEFGGMYSLKNTNTAYMIGSRVMTVAFGFVF